MVLKFNIFNLGHAGQLGQGIPVGLLNCVAYQLAGVKLGILPLLGGRLTL